mgnify:CR=1 FL=1
MMNLTLRHKELKATDAIKDYVEKKMPRIEKYFGEDVLNTENAGGVWGDKSVFREKNA